MNNYRNLNYSPRYGRSFHNPYVRQNPSVAVAPSPESQPLPSPSPDDDSVQSSSIPTGCSHDMRSSCKCGKETSCGCTSDNSYENSCCNNNCNCTPKKYDQLHGLPLAMAYVPWQEWSKPLPACEGFKNGTIFTDLILPFKGDTRCSNIMPRGGRR